MFLFLFYFYGRWNYHFILADVIAIMADGIVMYWLECKADVIAFVADGIAIYRL